MAFDQGASRPQGAITAKSTGAPQNAWRLKLKKIQRIYILFFFLAQKVGAGAQKSGKAAALPAPPPPRTLNDDIKGRKMTSKDTKGLIRTEKD